MRKTMFATALWILICAAGPAAAAPTAQVAGGSTTVELSDDFIGALAALGVEAAPIGPASLRRGWASFPIPAGALDLGTTRGDIFHSGGLELRAGSTKVQLLNFVIDTQNHPELTGLVFQNGDLIGRVPLFDLALKQAPVVGRTGLLVVRSVDVTLTADAAGALNQIFGVHDFSAGLSIGEAVVFTKVVQPTRGGRYDKSGD
jgi:hypothetical protein